MSNVTDTKTDIAWFKKYEELKEYKRREGHCNVPAKFSENKSLGMWVDNQRKRYKLMKEGRSSSIKSSITESRIKHLEEIGFQWSLIGNDAAWFRKYKELREYKRREGNCNVPAKFSENKSLGMWVDNQRKQYKLMKGGKPSSTTESRIKHLDEIGFQWSLIDPGDNDTAWLKHYEELRYYKRREGHCNVPTKFSENKSLGIWVRTQRRKYKLMKEGKPSPMTESRIKHLDEIGFQWSLIDPNANDTALLKHYEELKECKCREGHCNVPAKFSENKSLERKQCKIMKEGKPSPMTESRIKHLDEIGFQGSGTRIDPDANDIAWLKKYEELREYKRREGHCNVPAKFSENKSLGIWVGNQRKKYKLVKEGKPSPMTKSRIKHLEEIGFQWSGIRNDQDANDTAWFKKYGELMEYKRREGHCNVPTKFSENKSLGMWVDNQRRNYKLMKGGKPSPMTESRIKHLDEIGFQWIGTRIDPDANNAAWLKKYKELKEYKRREGNCNVPTKFSKNKSLGIWVRTQRKKYKLMKEGKSSPMTESRIKCLEEIGFQWSGIGNSPDSDDTAWLIKYRELKEYKRREGHCNISTQFNATKILGIWVSNQRKQYKLMKEGKPSPMTESRIKCLEEIGFQWSLIDLDGVAWFKNYEKLKDYKRREGHCNVPTEPGKKQSLGTWVDNHRKQYKLMKEGKPSFITESRINHLEEIGFQWSLTDSNGSLAQNI